MQTYDEPSDLKKQIWEVLKNSMDVALFINKLFEPPEEELQRITELAISPFFIRPQDLKLTKEYSQKAITLPEPLKVEAKLGDVIKARRSIRQYSDKPVSLETLSTILYYSYGVSSKIEAYGFAMFPLRVVPTTGGLAGVEVCIAANNVENLEKGLYHYNPVNHSLCCLFQGILEGKLLEMARQGNEFIAEAPIVLFLTIMLSKGIWKYSVRYFRDVLIDVGCIVENVYLVSVGLGLGACAISGIDYEKAARMLKIDNKDEIVILAITCGFPLPLKETEG
ncbi:MAG: SagB/ThcOx family dehydrogenase [Candidatus Bathyarchaeia archaeon]